MRDRYSFISAIILCAMMCLCYAGDLEYLKNLRNARIYSENQEWDKAIEFYNTALQENPEGIQALKELAFLYLQQKRDFRSACSLIEKLTHIISEDSDVERLSLICESSSERSQAIKQLDPRTLQKSTSSKVSRTSERLEDHWKFYSEAARLYKGRHFESALGHIEEALISHPYDITFLILKAEILIELGKKSEVEEILADIVMLRKEKLIFPSSLFNLASLYNQLGRVQRAFDYLKECSEGVFRSETALYLIDFVKEHKGMKEAKDLLSSIISSCERCSNVLWVSALRSAQDDDIEKAIELLTYATMADPSDPFAYFWLANFHVQRNNLEKAIENYERGLKYGPGDIYIFYNLGYAYYNTRNYSKSVSYYKKAIEIRPDFAEAYMNLGMAYIGLEKWTKAEAALKKSLVLYPPLYQAYYYLYIVAKKREQHDSAQEYLIKYRQFQKK